MLYKYPAGARSPTRSCVEENRRRSRGEPEFELLDTGIFDDDRYFDVFDRIRQGRSPDDILHADHGSQPRPEAATLHVLPQLWFRNTWSWERDAPHGHAGSMADPCGRRGTTRQLGALCPYRGRWTAHDLCSARTRRTSSGCSDAHRDRGLLQGRHSCDTWSAAT